MRYVDGYVLPVPKKNIRSDPAAWRRRRERSGESTRLDYKECVGEDLNVKCGIRSRVT